MRQSVGSPRETQGKVVTIRGEHGEQKKADDRKGTVLCRLLEKGVRGWGAALTGPPE